ncbi:hypothetical protein [Cryptosporangium arvum]|uniref:hypothetical protein n=1 Tax=Cryptosporangium arvum TaxID=80871 RepID=UPI0004BA49C5|nr:hypothetical protein [Cryptosporangium arvum]
MEQSTHDRTRSIALAGACAAFVAVPNLGALFGRGEQTDRYDTVITPPNYAFVVWAPIFAGCLASTLTQVRASDQETSRRTGWPLTGAYLTNTVWSLAAQSDRFAATPFLLPLAAGFAGVAHARVQGLTDPGRATPVGTGLLLGWTTLASAVNLAAGANLSGAGKESPRTVRSSAAGLLAVCAAVAAGVAASRRGAGPVAATSGWGLLTTALSPTRPRGVRAVAATGAAAIAAGLAVSRARRAG